MSPLENIIIRHAETAVRTIYLTVPVDPVHPIEHSEGVVRNTLIICQEDHIDPFMPAVAAWLHDYGRPAEYLARQNGIRLPHAEESARQVPIILHPFREALGIGVIEEIQTTVATHSRLNKPDDSLTTKILMDADRLEGFGSRGLYRTIMSAKGNRFLDPLNPFPDKRIGRGREASSETTVAQTMLYTLEWLAMLRMPAAIKIGVRRAQSQISFLEDLVEEYCLSRDLLEQNKVFQEARRIMRNFSI